MTEINALNGKELGRALLGWNKDRGPTVEVTIKTRRPTGGNSLIQIQESCFTNG